MLAVLAALNDSAPTPAPSGQMEHLFQDHHGQVFAAAYRVTGNAQDAEDVLQTVFLRLLRRQDELDLSPSPVGYLHRAAVNASLDLMRARQRSSSTDVDELDVPEPRGESDPERRQADREARIALRQAVLALSDKNAEIFSLRFFEDLSNRDIAENLGMSQTAVGVALHRARNQVKKEMSTLLGGTPA